MNHHDVLYGLVLGFIVGSGLSALCFTIGFFTVIHGEYRRLRQQRDEEKK